jgi:glucoamylase
VADLHYRRVFDAVTPTADDPVGAFRELMLANVASAAHVITAPSGRRSLPGCVIASPSWGADAPPPPEGPDAVDPAENQDYVYQWTRDAAIAAAEIAAAAPPGVDPTLGDYVAFSATCQDALGDGHEFFRACFTVDGAPRDWSDQKDGPALQALAFARAWPFLDAAARATATRLAQRSLERTVAAWEDDDGYRGPWEDAAGPSFFARAAQLRFLREVDTTNTLGLVPPDGLATALAGLTGALATHWDAGAGRYASILGVPDEDPNADVVMACLYGAVPATDPRLLATAAQLRAAFDVGGPAAYPINGDDRARGLGPLIGRYPADTYDGNTADHALGHPWAVCTANLAELYYRVAGAVGSGRAVAWDDLTGPFLSQVGLDAATVGDASRTPAVVGALRAAGDALLRAVVFHADDNHLSEQFDARTGFEKSVSDLTWSYASYLSAARERG